MRVIKFSLTGLSTWEMPLVAEQVERMVDHYTRPDREVWCSGYDQSKQRGSVLPSRKMVESESLTCCSCHMTVR